MLPLLNAIFTAFSGNSTLVSAFPGGLHRDRAPENTPMPYVVSRIVATESNPTYAGPLLSCTQVRFSAFGVGHDATALCANRLVAAFDNLLLTLSGGTHTSVVRLGEPIPAVHPQDSQGNDVWEWSVTYEYGVST